MTATFAPEFPAEDNRQNQLSSPEVRARLTELGITEADGSDAVAWSRQE